MIALILILSLVFFYFSKRNRSYLIMYFFILSNGFQLVPSTFWFYGFPFLNKQVDVILISTIIIVVLDLKNIIFSAKSNSISKYFKYLILLSFISSITAYFYEVSFVDQIRVIRYQLLPFTIIPLFTFSKYDFKFLFRFLYNVTLLLSILFIIQFITHKVLLFPGGGGMEVLINSSDAEGWIRYYNLPVYLVLFFFFSFIKLKEKPTIIKAIKFFILLVACIIPMHRGMLMGIFGAIFLYSIISDFSFKMLGISLIFILIIGLSILSIPALNNRLFEGFDDIKKIEMNSMIGVQEGNSTFEFRILHLFERFNYISQSPLRTCFGIGAMPEDIEVAEKLPLYVGNYKEEIGGIKKIDTSDNAWSTPLLRYGIMGLIMIFYFIKILWCNLYVWRDDKIIGAALMYLLSAILGSFTGDELISYQFQLIFLCIILMLTSNLKYNENFNSYPNL